MIICRFPIRTDIANFEKYINQVISAALFEMALFLVENINFTAHWLKL